MFSLIGVAAASTQAESSTGNIALAFSSAIGLISYLISRTPYYQVGSFLFVLGVSFSAYFSIATGGARTFSGTVFSFVPLALIFGSAILSPWAVIAITCAERRSHLPARLWHGCKGSFL
jgi:hypothetical protein